ncbi:hypothetical protein ACFYXD_09215 [Streptomyces platensis]|uniref:hypothetical protein n=1 Tax=Streptomyces platensis TaxID=58346 RepID=UPI0036AAB6C3
MANERAPGRDPPLALPFLRRSRLVAVLAGAGLFTLALVLGMVWFSPSTGSAQGPQTNPSTGTSPATPPPSTPYETASSPPVQPAKQKPERGTDVKPDPKKAKEADKPGKH